MCGISGFWSSRAWPDSGALARAMAARLAHRGPDGEGVWCDADHGIALSHRRLAIQDLSSAGHQPMLSDGGRYAMVFNGEIYNHMALREQLRDERCEVSWRGHSDTETVLACLVNWGLMTTLQRLNGMFAIALFDRQSATLHFARDRLGEKPLFIAQYDDTVLFGSELSALRSHPAFGGKVSRRALSCYLARSNVPAPYSIYEGTMKLSPGHVLALSAPGHALPASEAYWSLADVASTGIRISKEGAMDSDTDAMGDLLEAQVQTAVASRMISDVPLGAFLSGGIDSSLVVAMMQKVSTRPVRSFSIGFDDDAFNEAPHARAVADHLGTDHTELYVGPRDAFDLLPGMAKMYDEPFADSSQLPTALLASLTRHSVTVSLSGDGGDELFGGYQRYLDAQRIWKSLSRVPQPLRRMATAVLCAGAPALSSLSVRRGCTGMTAIARRAEYVARMRTMLVARDCEEVFSDIITDWSDMPVVLGVPPVQPQSVAMPALDSDLQRMMYHDTISYMPDTILTKVDRATMAASLESRAPLLDHELVEFAWQLPDDVRERDGRGKWLLREVLNRHVPRALIDRPKKGFGIPLGDWLRGELRDWAESLLDERRLREEGWFDSSVVRKVWQEHLSGEWGWQSELWSVLMFQAWLDEQAA